MLTEVMGQLEKVFAAPYGAQTEQFMFELVCHLVQKKDIEAAKAAVLSRRLPDPEQGLLEMVFSSAEDLIKVRGHADLLAEMAYRESVKILLRLEFGEDGMTPISPKQALHNQRRKPMAVPTVIALPGIQASDLRLSLPLLNVLCDFMEHPERPCGVVRLDTQAQIIITESSAKMILQSDYDKLMAENRQDIIRDRVADATKLKRRDYFFGPDLIRFMQVTQELEPNNPDSTRELTWQGLARNKKWVRYTHRYRLIEDELGVIYHVGENLGFEAIANPVAA